MGRLPTFTASVLKKSEPMEMAAMQEPWHPRVKVWSSIPYDSARGTIAEVGRGPTAVVQVSVAQSLRWFVTCLETYLRHNRIRRRWRARTSPSSISASCTGHWASPKAEAPAPPVLTGHASASASRHPGAQGRCPAFPTH